MKKTLPLTLAAFAVALSTASAQVLVNEDFESYTDTADMQVNWGAGGLGVLVATNGNPGQSAYHPGGTVNSWIGSAISVTPTATQNIVLTADIYDDGTSANERMTVGFRTGANPLFEMGHYNSTTEHYHVRVLNFAGNENWAPISVGLKASSGQPAGWNRYQATFSLTGLTVTLDLGADGSIDGTFTSVGAPSATDFSDLRFGGPSNVSSAGPGWFDNISLELVTVPEPTVAALGGFGLLALLLRRRASR